MHIEEKVADLWLRLAIKSRSISILTFVSRSLPAVVVVGQTIKMAKTDQPVNISALPAETLDFAHRMFEAAREGTSTHLLAAIDAGLPVNLTNDKGNTLLMLAAYAGHAELTRELLQRGADPNRLNDMGQSMIAGAVFKGHDEVVRVLAEKGADPRTGTPNAIQAAHMFGRTELMGFLGTKEEDIGKEVPSPLSRA